MSSPEHSTILNCASQLETALRSDRDITHHLVKEGFISEGVYDDVLDPKSMLSVTDKAGMLVAGIRQKVKTNSQYYTKLMGYFSANKAKYVDIIQTLEEAYLPLTSASTTASHKEHPSKGNY